MVDDDKRWKLEAAVPEEWEAWLAEQKKEASIKGGNIYLQVQIRPCVPLLTVTRLCCAAA